MIQQTKQTTVQNIFQLNVTVSFYVFVAVFCLLATGCASARPNPSVLFSSQVFSSQKEITRTLAQRGWFGFTEPVRAEENMGLQIPEKYVAGKIPVVFIHGLLSDTLTWKDVISQLEADEEISSRFQFWSFRYATGNTYLKSAADLRRELINARESFDPYHADPAFDQMVLVGHSMGGLIAKLQAAYSEDKIWNSVAKVPMGELAVSPEERAELESVVNFEPLPFVHRVVFIATPHAGSSKADQTMGRLGRRFVEFPEKVQHEFREFVDQNNATLKLDSKRMPTSLDHLSPRSEVLLATNQLRLSEQVRFHSIIGTGTGIPLFSSDGVVTRKSATFAKADSELLVTAFHQDVHRDKDAVEEIRRILLTQTKNTQSHALNVSWRRLTH
jgi:pimeloyl-ACP methyl ester carboxylesterase